MKQKFAITIKKLFKLETYEDLLVSVLRFLIDRSPVYLWFWVKSLKFKNKFKLKLLESDKKEKEAPIHKSNVINPKSQLNAKQRFQAFNSRHPFASAGISLATTILVFGAAGFVLISSFSQTAAAEWWDDSWAYRKKLTINSAQVTADLTDFPVLVSVTDTDLSSKAQSDGDDIVFTLENGTKLDHEIESYTSGTGVLVAWVRIPELDSDEDSYLYMYYGNAAVDNQQNAHGVWDESFVLVQHLKETGTGARYDSTRNNNDGTTSGYDGDEATDSGQVNGADDLDGTNDYLEIADNDDMDLTGLFTISMWIRPEDTTGDEVLIHKPTDAYGNDLYIQRDDNDLVIYMNGSSHGSATDVFTEGDWNYVTYVNNGSNNIFYVDTTSVSSAASQSAGGSSLPAQIGADRDGIASYNEYFHGIIDETRISNVARSTDWISTEYNNQDDPATFLSLDTEEVGPGPVGHWSFDEGFGTTANDSSGQGNSGTITGATWQDESQCVVGKCLYFDGSSDYVSVDDDPSLDLTDDITVMAWINSKTLNPSVYSYIITKGNDTGASPQNYQIYQLISSDGVIETDYYNGGWNVHTTGSNAITVNKWHHVAYTKDSSDVIIYIDGVEVVNEPEATAMLANDYNLWIGGTSSGRRFHGYIDEAKVYPYARTAEEIKADYAAGLVGVSSSHGVSASFGGESDKWMSDGLVGYWKMDESSWNGTADEVVDASGNGNHGTAANDADTTAGKFGNGFTGDGNDDYVQISDDDSLDGMDQLSISAWVYADVSTGYREVVKKRSGVYALDVASNKLRFNANSSFLTSTTDIDLGKWVHVVCVYGNNKMIIYYDGELLIEQDVATTAIGTSADDVYIGIDNTPDTDGWNGEIDEVRIYDRALSAREAKMLYEWAPGPVMHLKMDEKVAGDAQTLYDTSGNGNDGTTVDGANDSGMDCTKEGKYGSACEFDGVDDYISCGTSTPKPEKLSAFAWVKNDSSWDFSDYSYRKQIFVTNNTASTLSTGHTVWITLDTDALVSAGKMLSDGEDLRIAYWNGSSYVELDRHLRFINSTSTEVYFKTQADIAGSGSSNNYFVYYGNSGATSAPDDGSNVYAYFSDFDDSTGWTTLYGSPTFNGSAVLPAGSEIHHDAGYLGNTYNKVFEQRVKIDLSSARSSWWGIQMHSPSTSWYCGHQCCDGTTDGYKDLILFTSALNNVAQTTLIGLTGDSSGDEDKTAAFDPGADWNVYTEKWQSSGVDYFMNSTSRGSSTRNVTTSSYNVFHQLWNYSDSGNDLEVDWYAERLFVDPEPTTTLGSEDSHNQSCVISRGGYDDGWRLCADKPDDELWLQVTCGADTSPSIGLSAENVLSDDEWSFVGWTWDGDTARLYADGVEIANGTDAVCVSSGMKDTSTDFRVGQANSQFYQDDTIDDVMLYDYVRTQDQIIEDMNAGHPAGGSPVGSPVAHWSFEEGYGSTAHDMVGNNDGTLDAGSGGSQTDETEMWELDGKFGKAIEFDGTDDHVEIADPGTDSEFDFDTGDSITISQWVKPSALTAWAALFLKGDITSGSSSNYGLEMDGTLPAKLAFYHHDDQKNRSVDDVFTVGAWSHIAVTHTFGDGDTFQMYHNGEAIESTWISGDGDASPTISNQPIWMGNNYWDEEFTGLIDEVKVYSYAMTADQVKTEFNQGKSLVMGSTGTDSSGNPTNNENRKYCVPGSSDSCNPPVLELDFDEKSGTTAFDTSGNGNDGTLISGPTWTDLGKVGSALEFDGSTNYVDVSGTIISSINAYTVSLWAKYDSIPNTISCAVGPDDFASHYWLLRPNTTSDKWEYLWTAADTLTYGVVSDSAAAAGEWYHVTMVNDGSNQSMYVDGVLQQDNESQSGFDESSMTARVGNGFGIPSNYGFDGSVDDLKIYDYARTPAQIAWEYNKGGPVGWWKLDESTGTTAHDSSGKGNDGTLTNMDPATDWVSGKISNALDFDGSNDKVDMGQIGLLDDATSASVCFWLYYNPTSVEGDGAVVSSYPYGWMAWVDNTGAESGRQNTMSFVISDASDFQIEGSEDLISSQTWDHYCITYEASSFLRLYKNNVLDQEMTSSVPTEIRDDTNELAFGQQEGGRLLNAKVDDVRVYNYALTEQQIKEVINQGGINFQ